MAEANRTVKVRLDADAAPLLRKFVLVGAKVKETAVGIQKGFRDIGPSATMAGATMQKMATDRKATFQDLGRSIGIVGIAMGVVLGSAVKRFADFDQQMSYVKAVTQESAGAMNQLRDAALEAGKKTVFTALEAAQAEEELAKAGVSTANILGGGLAAALNLAAATGLSVAKSADIAAGALGMFELKGSDLNDVVDYLTAGATKSIGEVDDLSLALRQAGPVAHSTGLSIKETIGVLAGFASTGRIGLDAGTSFKRMLQLLTPQSKLAADRMKELGIDAFDAGGNFIGITNFAGQLQEKLGTLNTEQRNSALSTIYGSDAVAAATQIYNMGAKGVQEWIDKVDDQGLAARNAKTRLGNLKGDVEQLNGSIDQFLITLGSKGNGPMRTFVQGATGIVNTISEMDGSMETALFGFGATMTGLLLLGSALLLGVPKVAAYRTAMTLLTAQMPRFAKAIGAVGKIGGWFTVAIAAIGAVTAAYNAYNESLRANAVEQKNLVSTTASGANIIASAFQKLSFNDVDENKTSKLGYQGYTGGNWDTAAEKAQNFNTILSQVAEHEYKASQPFWSKDFGASGGKLGEAAQRLRDLGQTYADLADSDLPKAQNAFRLLFEQTDKSPKAFKELLGLMGPYRDKLTEIATTTGVDFANVQTQMDLAMGQGTIGLRSQTQALNDQKKAAQDAEQSIEDLAKTVSDYAKDQFDLRDSTRDTNQSFLDLAKKLKENAKAHISNADAMDMTKQVGIDTTEAMDKVAKSINETAAANYKATGSVDGMNTYLDAQRERLSGILRPLFDTDAAMQDYINTLVATPEEIQTQVTLNGLGKAQTDLDAFIASNMGKGFGIDVLLNPADAYTKWLFAQNHGGGDINSGLPDWMFNDTSEAANATTTTPSKDTGPLITRAGGGTARGPGTGTSDSIRARLSNGEEVIRADMATKYRPLLKWINAGAKGPQPMDRYMRAQRITVPTSEAGAGTTKHTEVNLTVINPVGERSSETIRKQGQLIGASLGV